MTEHRRVRIPKLFTIGYEGRTSDDLIASLLEAGVTRVIDVRELPLSRKRGFSKSRLIPHPAPTTSVREVVNTSNS